MKSLYLASLFLFGVSLVGLPALSIYLMNRNDFLIWGGILLLVGLVAAIAIDDGAIKIIKTDWETYIASVITIAFILIFGVTLQWR